MGNPNWYCKEVVFRFVCKDYKYEVGCDMCGFKDTLYDRRPPKPETIEYYVGAGCCCEDLWVDEEEGDRG